METVNILHAVSCSLVLSALYGVSTAILAIALNISALRSLGSMLKLVLYAALIYLLILFLPFTLLFILIQNFLSTSAVSSFFVVIAASLIVANVFANLKYYRLLWWRYEKNLLTLYALLLSGVAVAAITLPNTFGNKESFAISAMMILSLLTVLSLYLRGLLWESSDVASQDSENRIEAQKVYGRKIIWFGIDSATWKVIGTLLEEDKLPNLGGLIKNGCSATLKTLVPTHSPVLWTSKATGKLPLKHAIRDFLVTGIRGIKEPLEVLPKDLFMSKIIAKAARFGFVKRRPVSSLDRKCLSVWNILSAAGYRVGVTSWFVTDPVEIVNGLMVPELFYMIGKRQKETCSGIHPEDAEDALCSIRDEVIDRLNDKDSEREVRERLKINGDLKGIENLKLNILKDFYFQDVLRRDVTFHVCEKFDLDVLMVYFHGVDAAQHHFWKRQRMEGDVFEDTIANYYIFIDEVLGKLMRMMPGDNTIFVTSDHGHGPVKWYQKALSFEMMKHALEGTHAGGDDGIFIASGKGVREGKSIGNVNLCDIVPTILALMGLPVARDMDGGPVSEMFDGDVPPVTYTDSYEGKTNVISGVQKELDEDQVLLQRLRDLGYIE
jgi:predicted AlkP superfamily phosphohydrolase/phosphomutase